jgi:hypothetical protein
MGVIEGYLHGRLGRLFSQVGLPGWTIIVLGFLWEVFILVPEVRHAIEFWLGAAEYVGGGVPRIVAALTSPWFGVGLLVFGVGYLVFVGEPRWQIRHPLVPILGWVVVGVIALTFWSVLVAGYVAVHLPKQTEQVAPKPMRITEEEKIVMAGELKKAGSFPLGIVRLPDADSSYMADLVWILKKADWQVGDLVVKLFDEALPGLYILVPVTDKIPAAKGKLGPGSGLIPAGAEVLAGVLTKHHIEFVIQTSTEQAPDTFSLLFGSRP